MLRLLRRRLSSLWAHAAGSLCTDARCKCTTDTRFPLQASNITHSVTLPVDMGPERASWHAPPRATVTVLVRSPALLRTCPNPSTGRRVVILCSFLSSA